MSNHDPLSQNVPPHLKFEPSKIKWLTISGSFVGTVPASTLLFEIVQRLC